MDLIRLIIATILALVAALLIVVGLTIPHVDDSIVVVGIGVFFGVVAVVIVFA